MDTRDLYKLVRELSEERDDVINLYDSMDLELNEGFIIETGVVGFMEDGVIVHLDEDAMEFLDFNGVLLESAMPINENQDSIDAVYNAVLRRITKQHTDLLGKYGPAAIMAAVEDVANSAGSDGLEEIGSSDVSIWTKQAIEDLEAGYYKDLHEVAEAPVDENDDLSIIKKLAHGQEEVDEGLGKALLGGAALIAAITGINKYQADQMMKTEPQLVALAQMRQEAEKKGDVSAVKSLDDRIQQTMDHIKVTGRPVMDPDGKPADPRKPYAGESIEEAEYQGREVTLNKPMQGDVKKSKVYVKKPDGKVVKVNFGDKDMKIKKSNPERRKSFRARHNCDNPGPKWKARYWSCRAW